MRTHQVVDAIRDYYGRNPGEWFIFHELLFHCPKTRRSRRIDLFCLRMRGERVVTHSIEVKVDRADFKREVADLTKSQPFRDQSTAFFVATPKGLVGPQGVPEGWGHLEVRGDLSVERRTKPALNPDAEASSQLLRRVIFKLTDSEVIHYQALTEERYRSARRMEPA